MSWMNIALATGLVLFSLNTSAERVTHGELNAPSVPSSSGVTNAQVGALIYDESAAAFKGYTATGNWSILASPIVASGNNASFNAGGGLVIGGSAPDALYGLTLNGIEGVGAQVSLTSANSSASHVRFTDSSNYAHYIGTETAGGYGILGSGDAFAFIVGTAQAHPVEIFTDSAKRFVVWGSGVVESIGSFQADQGVQIATTSSQPACTSGTRGTIWNAEGGPGVADVQQICIKDASDAYVWQNFAH